MDLQVNWLGVAFVVFLVFGVYAIQRVRRFFRALMAQVAGAGIGLLGTPSRITLAKDEDGTAFREVDQAQARLIELGFEPAGRFVAEEMAGIRLWGFSHRFEKCHAVIYRDFTGRVWADISSESTDGKTFTVSNAFAGDEMDRPSQKTMLMNPQWPIAELFKIFKRERPDADWRGRSPDDFAADFQRTYAEEMDWRNSRGGAPSWDEFRRSAIKSDEDYTEAQLKDAYHQVVYTMAVVRLAAECLDSFQSARQMSTEKWEELRGRCFAFHEHIPNSHLPEFLRDHFKTAGKDRLGSLDELIDPARSPRENFDRFNLSLPAPLQAKPLGTVEFPVSATIYAVADEITGWS